MNANVISCFQHASNGMRFFLKKKELDFKILQLLSYGFNTLGAMQDVDKVISGKSCLINKLLLHDTIIMQIVNL